MNTSGNETHWLAFASLEIGNLTDTCMSSNHGLYLLLYIYINLLQFYSTCNWLQEIKCIRAAGTLLFS